MIFRCFPFCFATLFLSVVFSHDAVAQIDFDFPEADVPVLMVYEYYTEAYGERRPTLLVYSDGRVVRPVTKNLVDDYEFTLSEQKFKDVLNKIFVEHDFETISDKAILEEIVSKRKLKRPSPSAFRVTANKSDSSHVVDFGNTWVHDRLGMGRKRYPDAEQLQRFLKVEEICRELSNLALVGGEEAFQDMVKKANSEFKEAYPDGPGIGAANLFSVRRTRNKSVTVRFRVGSKVVDPRPVSVWLTKTKDEGESSIEVKVDQPLQLRDVPSRRAPKRVQ